MAMAFVGASSAMAGETALCKVDQVPCAAGNVITHVHETSVGKATFLGTPEVKCNVLFLGDALNGGLANPLTIHGEYTYTSCTSFCTVVEENGPARVVVLRTAAELAEVTVEVLVHITCPGNINCYILGEGMEGHGLGALTSGPNGSTVFTGPVLQREPLSSLGCSQEFFLDVTMTPLIATYIST